MSRFRWSDRLRGGLRDADYGYWRESRFNAPLIQDFGQARLAHKLAPRLHRIIRITSMTDPTITAEVTMAIATSVTVV
jgi:hypothetical protein